MIKKTVESKNILQNCRIFIEHFVAFVTIFLISNLFFLLLQRLFGNKYSLSGFELAWILLFSTLVTVLLYFNFLRKHKTLFRIVYIIGSLLIIYSVFSLFIPSHQTNKKYDSCRDAVGNTYAQALKERGYPTNIGYDFLREKDKWLWTRYLDELPKCDRYK